MQIEVANVALPNWRATTTKQSEVEPVTFEIQWIFTQREVLRLRMNNRQAGRCGAKDDWQKPWAPAHVNWLRAEAKQVPHATCRMPQRRLHYEWFGQQIATNCLQFKLNSISLPFHSPFLSLALSICLTYTAALALPCATPLPSILCLQRRDECP